MHVTTEVLVVGGGAAGLTAALALGRLGVPTTLVERRATTSTHPKATVVNIRTAELFRLWGVEEAVRARGLPLERSTYVSWYTRLAEREIGVLEMVDADAEKLMARLAQSPTLPLICPQSDIEAVLLDALGDYDNVAVRMCTELLDIAQDGGGVTATCRAGDQELRIRAQYVIAADGANSPLRTLLGIELGGLEDIGEVVNIHFAADLSTWTDVRPSVLYWIINPDVRGVVHALDGFERWLLNVTVEPGRGTDGFTPERCVELVRAAVGDPSLEVEVLSIKPWTMCAVVADRYREGRVLLAGDSAHQFPPTGGAGMNTGIQDAHNLAWKLAAVVSGAADDTLLDSYDRERRDIALANAEQSLINAAKMVDTGLLIDDDETTAQMAADDDAGAALRAELAAAIPAQRQHFVFDGQDLGFTYTEGAIVPDGSVPPRADDPIMEYVPSAHPGARAPHVWLEDAGMQRSTLDLFEHNPVLLCGASEAEAWRAAAGALGVTAVGPGGLEDPLDEFLDRYGIAADGAVLVRPDGHVAARFATLPDDPATALTAALDTLRGRRAGVSV